MPAPGGERRAVITVTAVIDDDGILLSLDTSGAYDSEEFRRRFYSISDPPPPHVTPVNFWGEMLTTIGGFLRSDAIQRHQRRHN
jgi:hypothetical protein